jgi:hypothetical protein
MVKAIVLAFKVSFFWKYNIFNLSKLAVGIFKKRILVISNQSILI